MQVFLRECDGSVYIETFDIQIPKTLLSLEPVSVLLQVQPGISYQKIVQTKLVRWHQWL